MRSFVFVAQYCDFLLRIYTFKKKRFIWLFYCIVNVIVFTIIQYAKIIVLFYGSW